MVSCLMLAIFAGCSQEACPPAGWSSLVTESKIRWRIIDLQRRWIELWALNIWLEGGLVAQLLRDQGGRKKQEVLFILFLGLLRYSLQLCTSTLFVLKKERWEVEHLASHTSSMKWVFVESQNDSLPWLAHSWFVSTSPTASIFSLASFPVWVSCVEKERREVRKEEVRRGGEGEEEEKMPREKGRMEEFTAPTCRIRMCFQGWRICQINMGSLSRSSGMDCPPRGWRRMGKSGWNQNLGWDGSITWK